MNLKDKFIKIAKTVWDKAYFWFLDFFYLSREQCIDILSNETNMFSMADRIIFDKKLSENGLKIEYYKVVLERLLGAYCWHDFAGNGIIPKGKFSSDDLKGNRGVRRGAFLKIMIDQKGLFLELQRVLDRMKVLEESELKELSEEERFLVKDEHFFNMTSSERKRLLQESEYFRLRECRGDIISKLVLSFGAL